jgi:benzoate membrane transport protein
MPIVMGMVAGVFLRFGTDLIRSLPEDIAIAGPMVAAFLLLGALPGLGRWLPPIIGALLAGGVAVGLAGGVRLAGGTTAWVAAPMFTAPQWSPQAMLELVVPLAITVLVVQNGQGVAVLRATGHEPPVNAITIACGIWSCLAAAVGAVSTCLTGPTNALLAASGERSRQYIAGMSCGLLAILFGLLAPPFTRLMLAAPAAFIATLGGLAMLRVLQAAFVTAFIGRFSLGALVTFLVTVTDVKILNIGGAFWGLVAGFFVAWLLERKDAPATPSPPKQDTAPPAGRSRLGREQ